LCGNRRRDRESRQHAGQAALVNQDLGDPKIARPAKHIFDIANRGPHRTQSIVQARENACFDRAGSDKIDGVNPAVLADAVDPANALFEPHGIPRELEIDDKAAPLLKIQSFAGRVSGNEHVRLSRGELADCLVTRLAIETPVKKGDATSGSRLAGDRGQSVAVLRKHDAGLSDAIEQPAQHAQLAVRSRSRASQINQAVELRVFILSVRQSSRRESWRQALVALVARFVFVKRQ
jgi:hypothetical protein